MACIILAAAPTVMTGQPAVTYVVNAGKSAGVAAITPTDPRFNAALDSFKQNPRSRLPNIDAVKPYLLIVTNNAAGRIMRLSVRRDITYPNSPAIVWTQTLIRTDGIAVLEPAQSLLAFQGITDLGFGAAAGMREEIDQLANLLANASDVVVTLDSVVFDSGMIVGPDRNGASVQYQAEQRAIRDLLGELRRAQMNPHGAETARVTLQRLAALSPKRTLPLPEGMRDSQFAYEMKQRDVSRFVIHRQFDVTQCINYLASADGSMKDLYSGH